MHSGQVSTMVIMDEEANKGASMPDLTLPVQAVSTAVITLVQASASHTRSRHCVVKIAEIIQYTTIYYTSSVIKFKL